MVLMSPDDYDGSSPFGRRVNELREQAGMSQAQLARALRTSKMRIYRIERGEVSAKLELIQELAAKLGVTAIDFLAPILNPDDPAVVERAQAERLEVERAAREQHELDRYVQSIERPALEKMVRQAFNTGSVMTDTELDLINEMLSAWYWKKGQARYIDTGVRERMRSAALKRRKKR